MRFCTVALVLLLTSSLAAQPVRWPTYTSPKKDFSVSAPGSFKMQKLAEKTQGATETLVYQQIDIPSARTYVVVRSTLTETAPNDQAVERLMTIMVNTIEQNIYRMIKKEVIKDKDYRREITYLHSSGMHFRSRIYLKENQLYTVSVSATEEKALDDVYSRKYLDSFKLLSSQKR
jgi:hypothetical protein